MANRSSQPKPKRAPGEVRARRRLERTTGRTLPKILHCSFCGKSQLKVEKLIAGPRGVTICNECVELCVKVVAGWRPAADKKFEPLERPTEELIEMIGSVNFMADANRDFLQSLVDTLRAREVSWAQIAEPLGVSRQSAWERFA